VSNTEWPDITAPGTVPQEQIHEQKRRDLDELKQIELQQAIGERTTYRRADKAAQLIVAEEAARKAGTEWRTPDPIGQGATKPQPFPTDALPAAFKAMVRAVAGNKQVPEDLPALIGLAVVATLAGPRLAIQRQPGWTEPLTLYTTVGLGSANLKSPATADVVKPLYAIEDELQAAWREKTDDQVFDLGERRAHESLKGRDAARIEEEIDKLKNAKPPRVLFYPDTTPEALAMAMAANGGCGGIIDSEGEFFAHLAGRYSKGVPNLGFALKAYDADRYGVDRVGREQAPIRRAVLALGLAVQPDVLESVARDRVMRERGLLGRLLFAVPESLLGWRNEDDATPYDPAAMRGWAEALRRIAKIDLGDPMADDFPTLVLSPEALALHKDFRRKIEPRLRPDGELGDMPGWGGKHAGRVLRIAGLLHLLCGRGLTEEVSERNMWVAVKIGWWAIPHAIAVFGMDNGTPDGDDEKCKALLMWARAKGHDELTPRMVARGHRVTWVKTAKTPDIEAVLDRLADAGWLRPVERLDGANRKATVWLVWPGLHEDGVEL